MTTLNQRSILKTRKPREVIITSTVNFYLFYLVAHSRRPHFCSRCISCGWRHFFTILTPWEGRKTGGRVRRAQREVRHGERQQGAWPGPLSWTAHCIFAGGGGFVYVTVAVSWQDV
jgi:hypothetical protein